MIPDLKDFTIRSKGHPRYKTDKVIEDDVVEVIVQKLEMILFTNTGDVFGEDEMGCNLEYYLWQTKLANNNLKDIVTDQIDRYVPELNVIGYSLDLDLIEGVDKDLMELNFVIKGYNITFLFE